jgi:hypothetical protein
MSAFANPSNHADGLPPPAQVMQLATSHFSARCLHVIAGAGIADHVSDTPRPSAAIAADARVDADALHRMLRLLAMHGLFKYEPAGWIHTPASALLRSNHPASMRAIAAMLGDPLNMSSLEMLDHSLKTGAPAASRIHKGGVWGYYAEHPELARQFDAAMTGKSHTDIALLVQALNTEGARTVADIAGGRGHFLKAILDAHPSMTGTLFDQPDVVANAIEHPRMTKLGGDFFKGGLPAADLYLMTNILHDWADAESLAILKNLRAAAPTGARLIVYELPLPEGPEPHPAKTLDVVMLAITGGRERTAAEYAALFAASGWVEAGVIQTPGPLALHVARAA